MTRQEAEARGWTFVPVDEHGFARAYKAGILCFEVASDDPDSALLWNVAEREGEPIMVGYGLKISQEQLDAEAAQAEAARLERLAEVAARPIYARPEEPHA